MSFDGETDQLTDLDLHGPNAVAWTDALPAGASALEVIFGQDDPGAGAIQVGVARIVGRPAKGFLAELWKTRGTKAPMGFVVAAVSPDGVWIYYPSADAMPIGPVTIGQAERQLQSVLDERDGLAAHQRMRAIQVAFASAGTAGFSNHFLFATYHLNRDVPRRSDWADAEKKSVPLMATRGGSLISGLGFETEPAGSESILVLRTGTGQRRAVAVLLKESEHFDQKSASYQLTPVAKALEVAGREDVPWVIALRKSTLRLYPGRDGVGVGQRGQSETYFELDLDLLAPEQAALLALIFSADALDAGGSAQQILDGSGKYAADLGLRLRDRVYLGVVEPLSLALANRLPSLGLALDADGLQTAYRLTMRILFRLLFQAYGEATELLPAGRNDHYYANSLQAFIAREIGTKPEQFSTESSAIWSDLEQVWDVIFHGNTRWDVPAYGGSIFDPATEEGALLKHLELPDSVIGPVLQALLSEETQDLVWGPVDFRSLQVREFGTIYEGLLESSLSLAEQDLKLDRAGAYIPAKKGDLILVEAGAPYFHSASGERKATGSYYTPKTVVDHLIQRAVAPALESHLAKIRLLVDAGKERQASAAFFDFRVADLAMGSAHFLVAAVDKIERGMRDFLTAVDVPGVRAELARLSEKARTALGPDSAAASTITDGQLLRRQVARRCVYGLDINPLAVELSRLALWIHTFVPGLPMSSLDHGLVLGNSLTGIGTVNDALLALDPRRKPGAVGFFDSILIDELEVAKERLVDFAGASEADKAEVEAGARLLADAKAASATARAIFDAAVAVRSGALVAGARFVREDLDEMLNDPAIPSVLARLVPAHFPYLFPEVFLRSDPGFDVIVGNPPWDKVRWEAAPFWAKVSPGLMALPTTLRDAKIASLRIERPVEAEREAAEISEREGLQDYFKGVFEWRGGTHLELAQLMLERALKALKVEGQLGLVLPRQALVLAGWKNLRHVVLTQHNAVLVQARNSGGWMFEGIDSRLSMVFLTVGPSTELPVRVAVVGSSAELDQLNESDMVEFTVAELDSFSETMVVPWFDGPEDRAVFDKMRGGIRLGAIGGWVTGTHDARWDFRGSGPDRGVVRAMPSDGAWSIMMTRHVDAYSLRQAEVKQFLFDWAAVAAKGRGIDLDPNGRPAISDRHPVVIFRHPSRSDDTRTLIASALPSEGYMYNKGYVHAVAHEAGTSEDALLALLGLLGSNIEDWWARRFVDRHVTAPVVNNLPLPGLDDEAIREIAGHVALVLVDSGYSELAGGIDVSRRAARAPDSEATSEFHLAMINALVAFGHGLTSADLSTIRSDFSGAGWPESAFEQACKRLDDLHKETNE